MKNKGGIPKTVHTKKKQKTTYKITNWHEYDKALVSRGSVEVWMDKETLGSWKAEKASGTKGGRPRVYSHAAILCAATFRKLFRLPLRATEGLVRSLLTLSGTILPCPDASTLSRRMKDLPVLLAKRKKEKTIIVVDSTGMKVYGEGEWKVRQHGVGKRRTWKKIHIGIGEDGEIRATEITDSDTHDGEVAKALHSLDHVLKNGVCYVTTSCGLEYLPRDKAVKKLRLLGDIKREYQRGA